MADKTYDHLSNIVHEVETLAKKLRREIRDAARASGFEKRVKTAANQLRKRAAKAAEQVERYVHQLRVDLEGKRPSRKARSSKPAARRPAARKRAA